MLKDLRLEDVDACIDRVAQGFLDARLFLEAGDPIVVIGHHNPVAADLVLRNPLGHQAGDGPFLSVATDGFGQVEINQCVAAEHHKGVIEERLKVLDLLEPSGGTQGITDQFTILNPTFKAVSDLDTEPLTISEVIFDLLSEMGDIHHHFGETMLLEQLQQKLHHRFLQDGNHRFRDHMGDRLNPCPLSSRQDHRLHRRF